MSIHMTKKYRTSDLRKKCHSVKNITFKKSGTYGSFIKLDPAIFLVVVNFFFQILNSDLMQNFENILVWSMHRSYN